MNGAEYPEHQEVRRLADLRDQDGWRFHVPPGLEDEHVITGVRAWPDGSADALVVRDFTDAQARRTNPDGGTVWEYRGGLGEVIDALLALPKPDQPGAPARVVGPNPGLWTSE